MYRLRKISLVIVCICLLIACGKKKKRSLSGEDPLNVSEFIEFFQPVSLPFVYSDTALMKKETDSMLISRTVFTQFVPDTLISSIYGKTSPKIYGLGKVESPKKENYIFIKTVGGDKRMLYVLAFDNKDNYMTNIVGLKADNNPATSQSVIMDRRFTLTKLTQLKNKDGSFSEGKDVYALSTDTRNFSLIMTDALVDKTELVNPIDTLAKKNKWSADYTSGKTNLVSIRDGRKAGQLEFFIHFDKNNGECTGEIKGEASITGSNTAEYKEEGDPCILKFIFSANSVSLQEIEGCGSRRPLNCTLNASFTKKKEKPL